MCVAYRRSKAISINNLCFFLDFIKYSDQNVIDEYCFCLFHKYSTGYQEVKTRKWRLNLNLKLEISTLKLK